MKKIYSLLGATLFMGLAFTACQPEEFESPVQAGVPKVMDIENDIAITVDQSTNEVTFSLNKPGYYPVWIFDEGKAYSTTNGLKKIFTVAGEYTVEVKAANANGVSDASVVRTFTLDNTKFDFDKYYKFLAGDESKVWYVAKDEKGHLGCGEPGTDGSNWWSAQPDDKKDWGVYDDAITFTADKKYTYNPGEGGTVYVNTGCTIFPESNTNDGADFMHPVSEQTTDFALAVEGADLFLTLPANTLMPYIPYDASYASPKFRIESINAKKMTLIADNGDISWRIMLTTEREEVFEGYKFDSDFNLWKKAAIQETPFFYYAPGWAQIADPECTIDGNQSYSFMLPTATTDQWQAQFHLTSDIALSAASNYDFSVVLNASTSVAKATVKVTDTTSDDNYLFAENVELKPLEDYVFYMSDVPGIDAAAIKVVFDFGGNGENCEVIVKNIVIKDHANDDGTVLPEAGGAVDGPQEPAWVDVTSAANLWSAMTVKEITQFCAQTDGWTEIEKFAYTAENGVYTLNCDKETNLQWQNQFTIVTENIALSADAIYDFCVTIKATNECPATVKLCQSDNDEAFLFAETVTIAAEEETKVWFSNLAGVDIAQAKLVFDFGGNPAGTTITMKDVILQKQYKADFNYDSDANMFKSCTFTNSYYYAPAWSQIADPVMTQDGSAFSFALPEATTDQWQAQAHFETDMSTSADKSYDFSIKLLSDADHPGVTVKLVLAGEGNDGVFYTAERYPLAADEEFVLELTQMPGIDMDKVNVTLDFGGCTAGSTVTVKDIILTESK